MTNKKQIIFYEKLVYVAYGFYLLLCSTWIVMSFVIGGYFNYTAFIVAAAFGIQAYYKHKLTNLLLGVLLFIASVFSFLEFLLMAGKTGFDGFSDTMIALAFVSIIMSGILMFSYLKLSFKDV